MGRSLRGRYTGVVRYTRELVGSLAPILGDDLTVFLTRAPHGMGSLPVRRVIAPFPTPNEYFRALWEQSVVPAAVARMRADVYHSPNYILPLALACPAVVTIHDLFYLDRAIQKLRSHLYLSAMTAFSVRRARRIICVSEYTRDRLLAHVPEAAPRVRVIGEGVGSEFQPPSGAAVAELRERLGLCRPFVLFVGTMEPRKNLARLMRAFERAVLRGGLEHDLVIAGPAGWKEGPIRHVYERSGVRDRIRLAGYLSEDDLPVMYGAADLFAYPSQAEGFGLPPLEAMACGTPVLTSEGSALAEVTGAAALLVDPLDEGAIACGLERLLADPEERRTRSEAGLRRAAEFRWDRVAEQTLDVYREAAA